MAWRRCGTSAYYQDLDQPSELHSAYLDPVDLVLVRTAPRRDGSMAVSRRQLVEFSVEAIPEHFVAATARRIDAWFDRISRQAEQAALRWKTSVLADLDVDPFERDSLLDSLEVLVDLNLGRVEVDQLQVPRAPGAVAKALSSMGVPRC